MTRDPDAARQAEALAASEARWDSLLASAVDAIIVIDATGRIEVFNPAAERLFGYAAAEIIGQSVNLLMPSPDRDRHDRYMSDYLRTGHRRIIGIGRDVIARRRDGSTFPAHLAVGEMSIGGERHFTGVLHDLTPRVELEKQVRDQATLARLGEMAAVIAHEIKNPLAAVRGAIQVVGRRLPADNRDLPVITEIVARIDALDGLIGDLLLFARAPQPRFEPVDLASLLRRSADFLSSDPAMKAVRINIDGTAPPILGDPGLLGIVLQNLLLNAAQAMNGDGTAVARLMSEGEMRQITISDTGPGLTDDARENLFRPFFTTKSRGTGLGLPTAKRLVELHGGSLAIASIPGGTVATVTLPSVAATGSAKSAAPA